MAAHSGPGQGEPLLMPTETRQISQSSTREIPVREAALFLDLDGTLAEFESTPGEVGPEPRRTQLLKRAGEALEGRLAVISGRSLAEVDRIVEAQAACAAGIHGLERRNATGEITSSEAHPRLPEVEGLLRDFAATRPGLLVEPKSLSVALHYRNAPAQADEVRRLARRLALSTGLKLQDGDRVAELRTPGADKGAAVRAFMAEPPFRGTLPIFVGDDLTDEDAFAEVESAGGVGVLVGPPRKTSASAGLRNVDHVFEWLDRALRSGVFQSEVIR